MNPNHDELGRFAEGGEGGGIREFSRGETQVLTDYTEEEVLVDEATGEPDIINYVAINDGLRGGEADPRVDAAVAAIDGAFGKVAPLTKDAVVYRGMRGMHAPVAPGKIYSDKAFVSTSLREEVAHDFSGSSGMLVIITLPKGSRVINLAGRGLTVNGLEKEILLPRGSRFRVDDVRPQGERTIIVMKLLLP